MLILEIFFYNFMLTMIITEIFYFWLCYYNYMTLSKCPLISYVVLIGLSLTQVLRVLDVGVGMPMLLYICQLGLYAYFGVYITTVKTKAYFLSVAKGELKSLDIDPSIFNGDDKEVVEDLILAAIKDAQTRANERAQEEMKNLSESLGLPKDMNLPF